MIKGRGKLIPEWLQGNPREPTLLHPLRVFLPPERSKNKHYRSPCDFHRTTFKSRDQLRKRCDSVRKPSSEPESFVSFLRPVLPEGKTIKLNCQASLIPTFDLHILAAGSPRDMEEFPYGFNQTKTALKPLKLRDPIDTSGSEYYAYQQNTSRYYRYLQVLLRGVILHQIPTEIPSEWDFS